LTVTSTLLNQSDPIALANVRCNDFIILSTGHYKNMSIYELNTGDNTLKFSIEVTIFD
jgi:hypothetical protein